MSKTIALITAAIFLSTSVTAQKEMKHVVANGYENSGCSGSTLKTAAIETGKCYDAKKECNSNPDLDFVCQFLENLSLGTDISFIASCKGESINAEAWKGAGCNGEKVGGNDGRIPIPTNTCLQDFKLVCSNNPNYQIPEQSSATSVNVGIFGLFGLLILQ